MEINQETNNKRAIPVMAFAAGVLIANLYYNQPILKDIALSAHVSDAKIGKISMLAQLGYGLGMFFIIPLGDKLRRKNLILTISSILCVALVGISFTNSYPILCILSFLIGVLTAPVQIILPMTAAISKGNRGKTVGKVFGGILVGMLAARVISGLVADAFGWRYVFLLSAALVFLSIILLKMFLPDIPSNFKGNYLSLLKSTITIIPKYSLLRQAALLGGLTFGIFCSFWTTLTFYLSGAPFQYGSGTIGLLGLVAIGGALVAPYFGKIADNGGAFKSLLLSAGVIMTSIILLKIFPYSPIVMIVSIFFLDIGVQTTQITNFARIYSLPDEVHNRVNTVFMTVYFIGGAIGTFFGLLCWRLGGWQLSTSQMLLWSAGAMSVILISERLNKKRVKSKE
ncbi:MFS transporter [Flavobacterium sp. ANB]|uniref:MFS transporter n=1 Tax=unclassified Flavobacterium TaxID=196869 RepID=UPI0012B83601|nr:MULTISPECIES: MFS transporter [unclassified Flavobacterium]MBF4516896.1 MFS transporter [Flavobacterium sp. ANB]MTD69208.1 MFS transporter [Flavobacterium sp. LC2016-13]